MTMRKPRLLWVQGLSLMLTVAVLWGIGQAQQRIPDVVYIPTPHHVVAQMLRIAGVTKDDVVYDLGSGDGRLVIAAAKHYGARGVGVDIDSQRIQEGRANARNAGVTDRVQFLQQDLFTTDIREATIVTLYLLTKLNLQLRPKLLSELKPGTRVVSHAFDMGDWHPDQKLLVPGSPSDNMVYYWVIPADVAGQWRWSMPTSTGEQRYTLRLQQRFQQIDGTLSADGEEVPIANATLTGDQLRFSAATAALDRQVTRAFDGRVNGNTMQGRMEAQGEGAAGQYHWTAHRDGTVPTSTHHH
jgi:SAM-dependent methyltransferase